MSKPLLVGRIAIVGGGTSFSLQGILFVTLVVDSDVVGTRARVSEGIFGRRTMPLLLLGSSKGFVAAAAGGGALLGGKFPPGIRFLSGKNILADGQGAHADILLGRCQRAFDQLSRRLPIHSDIAGPGDGREHGRKDESLLRRSIIIVGDSRLLLL